MNFQDPTTAHAGQGGDIEYSNTYQSEDSTSTTPSFGAGFDTAPNIPTGSVPIDTSTTEVSNTPMLDLQIGKDTKWSKLRAGGTSKEEAKKIITNEYNILVRNGADPDTTKATLLGDGKVMWDRPQFERNEVIRGKTTKMATALGAIKIDMETIVTGNMSDADRETIKKIGDYGIEQGWFKSYDPSTATAYLEDGSPIQMNDPSMAQVVGANKSEIIGSIMLGIVGARHPGSAVQKIANTYIGSAIGTYGGRIGDVLQSEDELKKLGYKGDKTSTFDLHRKGAVAAVTDVGFGRIVEGIMTTGTKLAKELFQSLLGRNTTSAVKTVTDLTGLDREALEKRAVAYARAGKLPLDTNKPEEVSNMILRNEIENNPALQGYLTKVVEEPEIAQQLSKNVAERTATMQSIGASTTSQNLLNMMNDSHKAVSKMMGSVRGALDASFDGTKLPIEQLQVHSQKIRDGLAPYINTIEERNARSAMDRVNASLQNLSEQPTMGNLFKLRTDYGSLLKKIGLFDTQQARRSTRLGTVDTQSLTALYHTMDSHIDGIIKGSPYLNDTAKKQLLDMKQTSDSLYSKHMKAVNTTWVKGLSNENASAKKSLDSLIIMGKEGREEFDSIMNNLTKINQDALEHSMVKRILDKSELGENGYSLIKATDDLIQLRRKIKNPAVLDRIDAIEKTSKIFQQDPVISMVANHRVVLDKLGKAGLTYNPKASLLYATWSKMFPRLQVAMVELIDKTPILRTVAPYNPLYGAIKTSAKEINLVNAAERAMLKGNKGSFRDFLDRALATDNLPPEARASIIAISKQYQKLADSFQGNQAEARAFFDEVRANPNYAGPVPAGANTEKIAQLRKEGKLAEIARMEVAAAEEELAVANRLSAKQAKIEALQAKVAKLKAERAAGVRIDPVPREAIERNRILANENIQRNEGVNRLRNGNATNMPSAGQVTINRDTGAIALVLNDATPDGVKRAVDRILKDFNAIEVRSADGRFFTRLHNGHTVEGRRNRIKSLWQHIQDNVSSEPRRTRPIVHNIPSAGKLTIQGDRVSLNTISSSSATAIREAAQKGIDAGNGTVILTDSSGTITETITDMRGVDNFLSRTAARRQQPAASVPNQARATNQPLDSRTTTIPRRVGTVPTDATNYISPNVIQGNNQSLANVGTVSFSSSPTKRYSAGAVSGGNALRKVVLQVKERGVDKAKVYELVDAFVNGGVDYNGGKAIEVKMGAKGFTFTPGSSIAHRMKSMGLEPPSGVDITPRIAPVRNRTHMDIDLPVARQETTDRVNEIVRKKLGFEAHVTDGGSISIKDINGEPKGHFSLRDGVFSGTTTSLTKGSGEGKIIYQALWDAIEGTGFSYQASSGLSLVNKWRMSANMLDYAAKKAIDLPHIKINSVQIGARNMNSGSALTRENAILLMEGYKENIVNLVRDGRYGIDFMSTTTDAELKKAAKRLGKGDLSRTGYNTLKMVRRFIQSGTIKSYSLSLAALLAMPEFISILEEGDKKSI